jgi:DNA-binding transcriptional LysR family regulator
MEAFVRVVDRGSFSAGARELGMTPSAVSKLVARLEGRLATRLVHRSTRQLQLTPEGRHFYDRSVRVLADMDEAERCAAAAAAPRGRVTINANVAFGQHVLVPLVPRFLEQYPGVTLDIALTDRVVDLIDERTDVAIRWGRLPPSDLIARKLYDTGQAIVGSPAYLARYGTPHTPQELEGHNRLCSSYRRSAPDWPLWVDGQRIEVPAVGTVRAGDGETLRHLALAGVGLARLSVHHIQPDIDAGLLVPLLDEFNPHDTEPVHAVYLGKAGSLPTRVRALLDFLTTALADNSALTP